MPQKRKTVANPRPDQKNIIEDVMHDFKEGDLKSGSGKTVKNRKQAVAIALSEAGASKNDTPKEKKHNLGQALNKKKQKADA